jgi:transposase-like protein
MPTPLLRRSLAGSHFSKIAEEEANKYTPQLGETFQADEMVVRVAGMKGDKGWLWDCMDESTRYLIASHLSPTRSGRDAEALLLEASKRAGKIPKAIKTDRLGSYVDGLERAFGSEGSTTYPVQGLRQRDEHKYGREDARHHPI